MIHRLSGSIAGVALLLGLASWVMMSPVRAQETVRAQWRMQLDILNSFLVGLTTVTERVEADYTKLFASGTGANQANALYHAARTLAASATEDLDLNASLTDAFGNSITCTKLKALSIFARAANTNNVLVGAGNTTITTIFSATNDRLIIRPGGLFILTAPDATGAALTAGSADVLTVANSAGGSSVTYEIAVVCVE